MKVGLRFGTYGMAAVLLSGVLTVAGSAQQRNAAPAPAKAKAPKDVNAPFPDEAILAERKKVAEGRPLFATETPFEFTLTADFKTVNKDRNPNSTKVFPATMTVAKADGSQATFPLNIRTRGHVRRMSQTCSFAPLRLEFDTEKTKGTIFEGHKNLKLGTHCRDADLFEQYVPREYSAYRIFNLLTPRSFRARIAKATYVDEVTKKPIANRMALFIEDDDDVARRMEGRTIATQKLVFRQVDYDTATLMTIFEYMIGNTDMSMYLLHNVVLVQTPKKDHVSRAVRLRLLGPGRRALRDSRQAVQHHVGPRSCVSRSLPHRRRNFRRSSTSSTKSSRKVMAIFDTMPGMDAGLPQGRAEISRRVLLDDQQARRCEEGVHRRLQQPLGHVTTGSCGLRSMSVVHEDTKARSPISSIFVVSCLRGSVCDTLHSHLHAMHAADRTPSQKHVERARRRPELQQIVWDLVNGHVGAHANAAGPRHAEVPQITGGECTDLVNHRPV